MTLETYPTTLPAPQSVRLRSDERRRLSPDGVGPLGVRGVQRARAVAAELVFACRAADWEAWHTWWRDTLVWGGAWFQAPYWSMPWGIGAELSFDTPPRVESLGGGVRMVSIGAYVRAVVAAELGPPDPLWADVILLMPFDTAVTEDVNDLRVNTLATDTAGATPPPALDDSDTAFADGGAMYTNAGDISSVVVHHADPWMAASGQPLTIELFYKPISKGTSQGTGSVFRNAFCGWATGYPFTTGNADSFFWINEGAGQLGYHNSGFFGALTMGAWNHAAIVYDPAGGATPLSVYSNGTRFIHTGAGASMPDWRAFAFGNCGRLGALFDGSYAAYLPTTRIGPIRVTRAVRYSGSTHTVPTSTFPTYGP